MHTHTKSEANPKPNNTIQCKHISINTHPKLTHNQQHIHIHTHTKSDANPNSQSYAILAANINTYILTFLLRGNPNKTIR